MNDSGGQTRIDLVRHGRHELGDVVCGRSDPELTESGWAQLDSRCEQLLARGMRWDACIASPRKRCSTFASELADKLSLPLVIDESFGEVDFGAWEGLTYDEISSAYPGQWHRWISDPDAEAPHGGERYSEFHSRVVSGWERMMTTHRNRNVLLLCHGGVIRAIMARVFSLDTPSMFRISIPHACHSRIVSYHQEGEADWYQLDSHNSPID